VRRREVTATRAVEICLERLHSRFALLRARGGAHHEWWQLRFEGVQALIAAQQEVIDLHNRVLETLRSNPDRSEALRAESIAVQLAFNRIRRLLREIEEVAVAPQHW
jgi:hypothetical protein